MHTNNIRVTQFPVILDDHQRMRYGEKKRDDGELKKFRVVASMLQYVIQRNYPITITMLVVELMMLLVVLLMVVVVLVLCYCCCCCCCWRWC